MKETKVTTPSGNAGVSDGVMVVDASPAAAVEPVAGVLGADTERNDPVDPVLTPPPGMDGIDSTLCASSSVSSSASLSLAYDTPTTSPMSSPGKIARRTTSTRSRKSGTSGAVVQKTSVVAGS